MRWHASDRDLAQDGSRKPPAANPRRPRRRESLSFPSTAGFSGRKKIWVAAAAAVAIVIAFGLAFYLLNGSGPISNAQTSRPATFVGSETCAGCHQAEAKLWNASQHKAAMQHATDKTVLGDFNDASFDYYRRAFPFLPQGR